MVRFTETNEYFCFKAETDTLFQRNPSLYRRCDVISTSGMVTLLLFHSSLILLTNCMCYRFYVQNLLLGNIFTFEQENVNNLIYLMLQKLSTRHRNKNRPRGYKKNFMLNLAEHEIFLLKMLKCQHLLAF